MAMDESVICLAFSEDGELLASGSTDGKIAVRSISILDENANIHSYL
jgi:WD40 repeat-containing protein SMU1